MKLKNYILSFLVGGSALGLTTSCQDMLDKGNDYVIYADGHELTNPADTVTSVIGILNKLQAISVRQNLLGEVRADLVKVNENASLDLKALAANDADVTDDSDANQYNVPRDYYAVINNCNFYLAHADSTAGNTNRNEKYFKNEIAQVHSIRAWVYLQVVLAYGRVPLITDPVVTKAQSEAQYPMAELEDICDYFINDLKPYVGTAYPSYGSIGGGIDPELCFYPTQIVLGDLYLWKAAATHDKEAAKNAAKAYYDYIYWNLSGKKPLVTQSGRYNWSAAQLYRETYISPSGSLSYAASGNWGAATTECITAIAMDSAAADGFYNELRNLYNTTNVTDFREASISPSEPYMALSDAQRYVDYDSERNIVEVTEDKLDDDAKEEHYQGDLRFSQTLSTRKMNYNNTQREYQSIRKHSSQHVTVYRAAQVYLRLAEALNYAGYPRFAKQILTMGLSKNVIEAEVLPYYQADSTFIKYFDFPNADFKPYAESYGQSKNKYGIVIATTPSLRQSTTDINMIGIHSRGAGLTFLDKSYCKLELQASDSVGYPQTLLEAVGDQPLKTDYAWPEEPKTPNVVKVPSTWEKYGNTVVTEEQYAEVNAEAGWYASATTSRKKSFYTNYVNKDSVGLYNTYVTVTYPEFETAHAKWEAETDAVQQQFDQDLTDYNARLQAYVEAYDEWFNAAYANTALRDREAAIVDQYILDEQALELAYEGNRFYDLMRRALWWGDNSRLANPVSKRDAQAGARLMTKKNWFLHWKGQIGF